MTVYRSQSRTMKVRVISHCFCIWEIHCLRKQIALQLNKIFDLLTRNVLSTYSCRGYSTSSCTRYLSTLPTCSFMGTGSVLKNEHLMVCLCWKAQMSTFQATLLFAIMFQPSNRLAGFKKIVTNSLRLENTQTCWELFCSELSRSE